MEAYYVHYTDFVARTMKMINLKEKRGNFDQEDIQHYAEAFNHVMKEDGISYLQHQYISDAFTENFDFFQYDNQSYIVLFPWVKLSSLQKRFANFLFDGVMHFLERHNMIPVRDKEELVCLQEASSAYLYSIQMDMQQEFSEHEKMVRQLTYCIYMTQKRGGPKE